MRHGRQIIVRRFHGTVFPFHAFDLSVRDNKSAHARSKLNFAASRRDGLLTAVIQIAQWNARNADAVSPASGDKCLPKYV